MRVFKEQTFNTGDLDIGSKVKYQLMERQALKYQIYKYNRDGIVVAIRFTNEKVLFDILDTYYSKVFKNIDSAYVVNNGNEKADLQIYESYLDYI
jgi:hypothetical protein